MLNFFRVLFQSWNDRETEERRDVVHVRNDTQVGNRNDEDQRSDKDIRKSWSERMVKFKLKGKCKVVNLLYDSYLFLDKH